MRIQLALCAVVAALGLGCGDDDPNPTQDAGPNSAPPTTQAADGGQSLPLQPQAAPDAGSRPVGARPEPKLQTALEATRPVSRHSAPAPYYRLDLARDGAGQVSVRAIHKVELSQRPLPTLDLDYVVSAHTGQQTVTAVPMRFATAGHTTRLVNGSLRHTPFDVRTASASVLVDARQPLERLELRDARGEVRLSVESAELAAAARGAASPKQIDLSRQALDSAELARTYPSIGFLSAGDEGLLSADELEGRTLVSPDGLMNDVVTEALSRAAPLLLGSVQHLGWAVWPKATDEQRAEAEETLGLCVGSTVLLNADLVASPQMLQTVLHEAAHAFVWVTEVAASTPAALSALPADTAAAAQELVKTYRLVGGFSQLWAELHASGQQEGHTAPYQGTSDAAFQLSDLDARNQGVASAYGLSNEGEDIAEYVGTAEMPSASDPGVCPVFDGLTQLNPAVAIPYAKLVLLLGAGAITDAAFGACVRNVRIDAPKGFSFPGPSATFADSVQGGLATDAEGHYFRVLASGRDTYQIMVEIPLASMDETPLGLHRLDDVWIANYQNAGHTAVYLANSNVDRVRTSASGLVLVTESTEKHQEGVVFGLRLQNGFGLVTDSWSFGTFAAP